MYVIKWKHDLRDFKIKSKADVKLFLEEMLDGSMTLLVAKDKAFFVRTYKKGDEKLLQVAVKYGNLYDVFNPEIILDEETAISELYKIRKLINEKIWCRW